LRVRTGFWPGARAAKDSLLIELQSGKGQPIFWCVQLVEDVLALKQIMANFDNPAYACSSLHQLAPNGEFDETDASLLKALATFYVGEIRAIQPDGPYFLAGHCSGAEVAYEIAQQLTSDGCVVERLFLVEPAQSFQVPTPVHALTAWLYLQAARGWHACIRQLSKHARAVKAMNVLGRALEAVHGASPAVRSIGPDVGGIRDRRYEAVSFGSYCVVRRPGRHRFFSGALDEYAAAHGHPYLFLPFPGPITLIYGNSSQYNYGNVPILRKILDSFWGERARGGVEMHTVSGGHCPWDTENGWRAIVAILSDLLRKS
jgi:hypothetical protein